MRNHATNDGRPVSHERDGLIRESWMFDAASACQLMLCEVAFPVPDVTARVRRISTNIPPPAGKFEELILHGMLFEVLLSTQPGASLDAHTSEAVERTVLEIGEKVCLRNRASEAAAYIETRLTESLDVVGVARHAGCSETTLRRLFREEFDVSMRDYLTRIRVRQAIRILACHANAGDLARAVGYGSEKELLLCGSMRHRRHTCGFTKAQHGGTGEARRIDRSEGSRLQCRRSIRPRALNPALGRASRVGATARMSTRGSSTACSKGYLESFPVAVLSIHQSPNVL